MQNFELTNKKKKDSCCNYSVPAYINDNYLRHPYVSPTL